MKFTVAATCLLSTTMAFVVTPPPVRNTVSSLSATERDISSIVEKMSRLDPTEKANMKSLLFKAGDVHPDDVVVAAAASNEMETVAEPAVEPVTVSVEESSPPVETSLVSEEAPVETTIVSEAQVEPTLVSAEAPVESTLVSAEPASPVEELSVEPTAFVSNEAVTAVPELEAVDVSSVTESSSGDPAVEITKTVVETTDSVSGQDTNMLADLVTDVVVNSSSELVETVTTALSQLS